MHLFCVGLSHHTADVETREKYAPQSDAGASLREAVRCSEALVLATCNRVEVYGVSAGVIEIDAIARALSGGMSESLNPSSFYRHEAKECVQHLFRVASGLDSMVIGETEILGQAKKAYESARASGGAGPFLHRLFQRAFRVAKQVRSHTDITRGSVSVGSAAVDLAARIFGELSDRKVLVLGAGDTSEKTARALVSRGVRDVRVSNRSPERAADLASIVGGRAVPFESWREQCGEIDILISSTAATEPLLTPEMLAPLIRQRLDRPLFIIDIAVPRDVAPEVNDLDGVYLYDIDSLQSIAEQSIAMRRQQMAAGEEIIAAHVADFAQWLTRRGGDGASDARADFGLAGAPLRASES